MPPSPAILRETLERFFDDDAPLERGDRLVVAFSGGPDSTVLLYGACGLAERRGFEVTAAHLDHGLDPDSSRRAEHAARLAAALDVPLVSERLQPVGSPSRGLEDWARRARYDFLERCREAVDGRWVATAHHRDDQIETVLLRVLLGSGVEGLGAIEPRRGSVVRPLLALGRDRIAAALEATGLEPVDDPTNDDPARPRNLIRHHLAPRLLGERTDLDDRLVSVAALARRLSRDLDSRLGERLSLATESSTASLDLDALVELHPALRPFALSLLHRAAGLVYPAAAPARRELDRQLAARGGAADREERRASAGPTRRIGCDCGDGWLWRSRGERLELRRRETPVPPFAYTLTVPGDVAVSELGLRVSIERQPLASWMFEGRPERAALELTEDARSSLTVRNRRPGDRIQPLGCPYSKRLKEVLIDRGVPREQRDRLPLLCHDDRVAWVPGVTIDERCRLTGRNPAWIVSLERL